MATESYKDYLTKYGGPATSEIIRDSQGNMVGSTTTGSDVYKYIKAGMPVYPTDTPGKYTTNVSATVSLDSKTGKITVSAPQSIVNSKDFQDELEILDTYSAAYKANPNAKLAVTDAKGKETGEELTVTEYIDRLNTPVNIPGTDLQMSPIQQVAASQQYRNNINTDFGNHVKVMDNEGNVTPASLTKEQIVMLTSFAQGDDANDDTLIAIAPGIKAFEEAGIYKEPNWSEQSPYISQGRFKELWYNRSTTSRSEIISTFTDIERWLTKWEDRPMLAESADLNKYASMYAIYNYMIKNDPYCDLWHGIGDATMVLANATRDVVLGGSVLIGTAGGLVVDATYNVGSAVYERVMGFSEEQKAALKRDKSTVAQAYQQLTSAHNAIKRLADVDWASQEDAAYQAYQLKDSTYSFNRAADAAEAIVEGIENLAIMISAGNALANLVTAPLQAAGAAVGTQATALLGAEVGAQLGLQSTIAISSGTQALVSLMGAEGAANLLGTASLFLTNGVVNFGLSTLAESVGEALFQNPQEMARLLAGEKMSNTANALLWENYAINTLYDVDQRQKVLNYLNGDADSSSLESVWNETYWGNVVGGVLGIQAGKALMNLGYTTFGRAASTVIRNKIYQLQAAVGDSLDALRVWAKGYDDIWDWVDNIKDPTKREVAELKRILRAKKAEVATGTALEIVGKSKDEILEQLDKVQDKVDELLSLENAIDDLQRGGTLKIAEWTNSMDNPTFAAADKKIRKLTGQLMEAEQAAGLKSAAKVSAGALFSKETTEYIGASVRVPILENALKAASGDTYEAISKELAHWQSKIADYQAIASPELLALADEYVSGYKSWWKEATNLWVKEGLLSATDIERLRRAGIWGENGELYARLQRQKEMSDYVIARRDGRIDKKTIEDLGHYNWGSTDEFVDPMLVMQDELRRQANASLRQQVLKDFYGNNGATVVGTASAVRTADAIKPKMAAYEKEATKVTDALGEQLETSGFYQQSIERVRAREAAKQTAVIELTPNQRAESVLLMTDDELDSAYNFIYQGKTPTEVISESEDLSGLYFVAQPQAPNNVHHVTKAQANKQFKKLDTEAMSGWYNDANISHKNTIASQITKDAEVHNAALSNMYDQWKVIQPKGTKIPTFEEWLETPITLVRYENGASEAVGEFVDYYPSFSFLPDGAKSFDIGAGRTTITIRPSQTLGMPSTANTVIAEGEVWVPRSLAYQESLDSSSYLSNQAKRYILSNDNQSLTNETLNTMLKERYDEAFNQRMVHESPEALEAAEAASKASNLASNQLYQTSKECLFSIHGQLIEESSQTGRFINDIATEYGGESPELVTNYLGWEAMYKNRSNIKKQVVESANKYFENMEIDGQPIAAKQARTNADELGRLIKDEIESQYNVSRATLASKGGKGASLVDKGSWQREIYDTANEITELRKHQNIVAIQNADGATELIEVDPLLADFVTKDPRGKDMGAFGKANYLWMKLFRMGTTGINPTSMVNQEFRDLGNAWIMGNVTTTITENQRILTEIFGENAADILTQYSAEAQENFMKLAKEQGRTVGEVVAEAEIGSSGRGGRVARASTESEALRLYKQTREMWYSDGAVKDSAYNKLTNAIDRFTEKAGFLNETRETYLRNLVYANNYTRAIKNGRSVQSARIYAEYIAANATTNFNRATGFLSSIQNTIPYLRSAINGTKSFWRLWSLDPVGVTGRLLGGMVIPVIGLTAMSLSSEENRQAYNNIKEYQKESALPIVVNGEVFMLPLPQELAAFTNPFRQAVEEIYGLGTGAGLELVVNDLLDLSPIDFGGFTDLDSWRLYGTGVDWGERLTQGSAQLFSQIAPKYLTAMATVASGRDLYTGKKIDTSYTTVNPDTGAVEVISYTSGALANKIHELFPGLSAPIAQDMLENIFGVAGNGILDFLVEAGNAVYQGTTTGQWAESLTQFATTTAEGLSYAISKPVHPYVSNEVQQEWKSQIGALWEEKKAILAGDAWQSYIKLARSATSQKDIDAAATARANIIDPFYEKVKNVVTGLMQGSGMQYTNSKFASVLSLMNLQITTSVGSTALQQANEDAYREAKRAAITTMTRLGFPSVSTSSMLGEMRTSSTGETYISYYSPLEILDMEQTYYGQSNIHRAEIESILSANGITRGDMFAGYNQATTKSAKKQAKAQWNARVINALAPYIQEYGVEAVINNQETVDLLKRYIFVDNPYTTKQYLQAIFK